MRTSAIRLAVALVGAACLAACGGGGEEGTGGAPRVEGSLLGQRSPVAQQHARASRTTEETYDGTLSITVDYYGYDCQLRDLDLHPLGTRTYEMPVQVVRSAQAEAEGARESGPFNLVVGADPSNEAGITIVSATVAADPQTGERTLFEYWRLSGSESEIEGELVQSWRQAGLALNVFPTDRLIVPCRPELGLLPKSIQTIDEGARLSGTITDERADLTIEGRTFDHERRFTARISATR